jgi:hypothetical protein
MLLQHGNRYERAQSKYRWVSFSCLPYRKRGINLDPHKAVKLVEETCYRMASLIDQEVPVKEYNSILSNETLLSFPAAGRENNGVPGMDKGFEHVIHWILFGAGIDIKEIGDYQNSRRVVYKNGFNPGLIPAGVEKYQEHIGNLAAKI